jgi:hypothetical protein
MSGSPCHDSGLTIQEYYSQFDMDNRDRVLGNAVDRGAYEIECEDTTNSYDLNADGLVNLFEFSGLSRAWLGHDPNDPVWLGDPNLADPNLSEDWYDWKHKYNYNPTGSSQYSIDLADLIAFLEDAPWLWQACWLNENIEPMYVQQMQMFSVMEAAPELSVVEEKSVQEQISDLAKTIFSLEKLWLEEPDIQQQIDPEVWQRFMETVYGSLLELQIDTVQIE